MAAQNRMGINLCPRGKFLSIDCTPAVLEIYMSWWRVGVRICLSTLFSFTAAGWI